MTNPERNTQNRPERRRNHGSRARIPGDFFRATAHLYLELRPDVARENLARRIANHLALQGVEYHVRTVRRQILGIVTTVPPEVEDTMRRFAREDLGFSSDQALLDALAARGHQFAPEERRSRYVAITRLALLTELWLYFNRGRSKRVLARRLSKDLAERGVRLSFDSIQGKLAGKGHLVRREVLDQMLSYLAPRGISTEAEALAFRSAQSDRIGGTLHGRELTGSVEFRKLCRLWQLKHKEGSSRRLAQLLKETLAEDGVNMSITHLQRAIGGKTPRIRRDLMSAMEALLETTLPEGRSLEQELEATAWNGTKNIDLAWVDCAPIATMAGEWLTENPDSSMRQLAILVAGTIRRMGYASSHNTIQPILGGWKKKTRGYVYRAVLKQFADRPSDKIPEEHIIGPVPGSEFAPAAPAPKKRSTQRVPSLNTFLRNARKDLASAKSPHVAKLLALRAERIYGLPAAEISAKLEGKRKKTGAGDKLYRSGAAGLDEAGWPEHLAADDPSPAGSDDGFGDEGRLPAANREEAHDVAEAPIAAFFDSEQD